MVGDIVGGGTPRSDNPAYFADEGIPWLTPADLNGFKPKRIHRGRRCITNAGLEDSSARLLPTGSVLFSSRAPIGHVAIAGTELATNQGFKSCVPFIPETNEFLYFYLMSAAARIDREASGTTFREVSGKIVSQIPIPLPPLAEQKRIVAKVDELMALCDRLEAQQQERESRACGIARASLARFADTPTPANLNFLFHKSYPIPPANLRKSILTLAVQGKLVPQDPTDESAAQFVRQLQLERKKTFEEQLSRARGEESRPPRPPRNGFTPHVKEGADDLPTNWCETRVGDVGDCLDYLRIPVNKSDRLVAHGTVPYYGANGQVGWIDKHLFDEDLVLVVEDETFIGRVKPSSLRNHWYERSPPAAATSKVAVCPAAAI